MDVLQILDAPETFAYIEHEITCPFCESPMLNISLEEESTNYRCGCCENNWSVLSEAL